MWPWQSRCHPVRDGQGGTPSLSREAAFVQNGRRKKAEDRSEQREGTLLEQTATRCSGSPVGRKVKAESKLADEQTDK